MDMWNVLHLAMYISVLNYGRCFMAVFSGWYTARLAYFIQYISFTFRMSGPSIWGNVKFCWYGRCWACTIFQVQTRESPKQLGNNSTFDGELPVSWFKMTARLSNFTLTSSLLMEVLKRGHLMCAERWLQIHFLTGNQVPKVEISGKNQNWTQKVWNTKKTA